MNNVQFMYQGKPHRGLLAISTKEYPRFYWFFPLDPKLALAVGECLSFKAKPGAPWRSPNPVLPASKNWPKRYGSPFSPTWPPSIPVRPKP